MNTKSNRVDKYTQIANAMEKQASTFKTLFIPEPMIELGHGGKSVDPKAGIALFGPCGTAEGSSLKSIRVGMIGTGDTITAAVHWLNKCKQVVHPSKSDIDPILFPSFPGMESEQGFSCTLEYPDRLQEVLTPGEIARCTAAGDRDSAVNVMAAIVRSRLEVLSEKDTPPDVVIVALPMEVKAAAGAGRKPPKVRKNKKEKSASQQLSFLDLPPPMMEPEVVSRTLHRAIKAEGMRAGLPTQMAWPSAFSGTDSVQDDATRAWNFCTALFYKAGGVPWRVTGLDKDTCYIGITFFRPIGDASKLQTSMAQAFSDRGDGIVLRGESFEWDRRTQGEPHLSKESAKKLIGSVIEQYTKHLRRPPSRVVVHKSSGFSKDEVAGMQEALGDIPYFDFISISRSNVRFMRMGQEPPLRGTSIEVADRKHVFYTGGYVPFLKVYPGMRIPCPLMVSHQVGTSPATKILSEILSLTKLNWNAAAFATANPITVDFSNNVGLILSELPDDVQPRPFYRYYM